MFKIPKIEKSQIIIDRAMKNMQQYALNERESISERFKKNASTQKKKPEEIKLNKRKDLELSKIRYLSEKLNSTLRKTVSKFPRFEKVDDIYIKLIDTSDVSVNEIKDSINRLIWIANTVDEFSKKSEHKIKKAKTHDTIGFIMKKHLGKINSLFKKNKEFFQNLEEARKFMNKLPKFEDMYTISIAGFPNVGKSTLMKKITGSDVEIQNYPFTTKGLMFGYIINNNKKVIQLIDTPGLLNRKEKDNPIEMRAKIVLHEYCNSIVFVLDITESCGYTLKEQLKLLKETSKYNKTLKVYLSKTDIYNEEDEESLKQVQNKIKEFEIYRDSEELKSKLIKSYLDSLEKFDPKKIKLIK